MVEEPRQKLLACLATLLLAVTAHAQVEGVKTHQQLLQEINTRIRDIDTESLRKLLDDNPNVVLLDVRTPAEVASMGRIDAHQQVNIPRGWVEVRIANEVLDKDTPIVAYCGAGIRSAFVADTLQQMGFTNVHNYAAGYLEWERLGLPHIKGN